MSAGTTPVPETPIENQFRLARLSWPVQGEYRMASGPIMLAPGWQDHEVKTTLDLSGSYGPIVRGDANTTVYGTGTGTTLDLTGCRYANVENMTIRADAGGVAMRLARRADGASSGFHLFRDVRFEGLVIIEASECDDFTNCTFTSKDSRPALLIRNGPAKPLGYTMQQLMLRGCQFVNFYGGPGVQIEATATTTDITLDGGGFSCGGRSTTANDAAMVIDTGNTPDHQVKQIHIANMRWETSDRLASIAVTGDNGVVGLSLRDSTFHQREALIRGSRLDYLKVDNVDTFPISNDYRGPAIDSIAPGARVSLSNWAGLQRYNPVVRDA